MAEQLRSNNSEFSINTGNRARLDLTALQARAATWNLEEHYRADRRARTTHTAVSVQVFLCRASNGRTRSWDPAGLHIRSVEVVILIIVAAVRHHCCATSFGLTLGINLWQRAVTDA
eukprot:13916-Heterococcus_DN1.PRE.2